jgi:two-component system sensor histidine kinase RegB
MPKTHLTEMSPRSLDGPQANFDWLGAVDGEPGALRTKWLIGLRWVAICGQLGVAWPAVETGWLDGVNLPIYLMFVAVLTGFNVLCMTLLRQRTETSGSVVLQLGIDLTFLAALLVLAGGVYNPMASIILLHASLGPILFRGIWSAVAGGMLVMLIWITTLYHAHPPALGEPDVQPFVQGTSFTIVALTIWMLTTWLTRSLRKHRALVERLKVNQTRLDRLRATGVLAAGFCHELATPLNTIGLRLRRIATKLPADDSDLLVVESSLADCERALRAMIGSTVDADALRFQYTNLPDMLHQICREWPSEGYSVIFDTPIMQEWDYWIPRVILVQTIMDLLDNAAEALASAALNTPIEIHLARDVEHIEIEVRDLGPGVPATVREHLGQPFATTKSDGTGLGLYNARNLCLALGGDIRIVDREQGGTSVILRLSIAALYNEEGP